MKTKAQQCILKTQSEIGCLLDDLVKQDKIEMKYDSANEETHYFFSDNSQIVIDRKNNVRFV